MSEDNISNPSPTPSKGIPSNGWTLDHVGHAVESIEAALAFYTKHFGFEVELTEELPEHKVDVAFLSLANTSIELIAPRAGNKTLRRFLDRRGPGLHHICFEVADIGAELVRLTAEGIRTVDAVPRPGSRSSSIAFLHPDSTHGALIELCSYAK